jgi:hypothetical protein
MTERVCGSISESASFFEIRDQRYNKFFLPGKDAIYMSCGNGTNINFMFRPYSDYCFGLCHFQP